MPLTFLGSPVYNLWTVRASQAALKCYTIKDNHSNTKINVSFQLQLENCSIYCKYKRLSDPVH